MSWKQREFLDNHWSNESVTFWVGAIPEKLIFWFPDGKFIVQVKICLKNSHYYLTKVMMNRNIQLHMFLLVTVTVNVGILEAGGILALYDLCTKCYDILKIWRKRRLWLNFKNSLSFSLSLWGSMKLV